ncbi:hypothetical protein J4732_11810 [Serratia marcescens]|uniref:Autoinducer 2 kinase LsrK n=1 Tax=Serratia marcescens TaxID=615 RepID=A0A939SVA0_SERMA|nr:hypothetical protein [Serratia marcescens]
MDNYLMALDAGTGSIRAVIFDMAGNQIAHGRRSGARRCRACPARWSLTSAATGSWPASAFAEPCSVPG